MPHIGTFNEVLRTTMVRNAYRTLTDGAPTALVAFSDDMDGLRRVPDTVPDPDRLAPHLGRPLSAIPDPWGCHDSFAAHNNAQLCAFLDRFGFAYSFVSATERYASGAFDESLRQVLRRWDAIMAAVLPTLRAERRATYAPILPISPTSGRVLQVPVTVVDADAGVIAFDDDGARVEQSALGGAAKCQWKVDWAMRWVALGVDYEMYGKDLTDSGVLSGRIAAVLGGRKPEGLVYELFLDERGEKISKSRGNGLAIEDWLRWGPRESVAVHAYREPKSAKQLGSGVVPRAVDEYYDFRRRYAEQPVEQRLGNPVHHIHDGQVPPDVPPVTFGLLLNLAGVLGPAATRAQMAGYLERYGVAGVDGELAALVDHALAYNREVVAPTLRPRAPNGAEVAPLEQLDRALAALPPHADAEAIQRVVYAIGNEGGFASLKDWFRALYETLLGTSQGPRMGSFIALYGIDETRTLIAHALARVADETTKETA